MDQYFDPEATVSNTFYRKMKTQMSSMWLQHLADQKGMTKTELDRRMTLDGPQAAWQTLAILLSSSFSFSFSVGKDRASTSTN